MFAKSVWFGEQFQLLMYFQHLHSMGISQKCPQNVSPVLYWLYRSCISNNYCISAFVWLPRSSDHNEQALMLSSAIELWSDDLRAMTHIHFYMTWPTLPVASTTSTANTRSLWMVVLLKSSDCWTPDIQEHMAVQVLQVFLYLHCVKLWHWPKIFYSRLYADSVVHLKLIFVSSVIAPLIRPQWTSLDVIIGYRTVIWWPVCNDTHVP